MEVEIDADVGRWVLEFLLRQPLSDHLLNSLISILPLTNNNSSFEKYMLLRKLESEISKQSISETLLDLLQQIEEIDFRAGITEHTGSIKAAYAAVAVSCTIKALGDGRGSSSFAYFDAVKMIWRGRVCKLQKAETVGLISEELLSWKDDIEAAVWQDSACDNLLKRSEGIDAIEAIRVYVKEEIGKMGPSFLELAAEAFRVDEELRVFIGNLHQVGDEGMDLQGDNQDAGPSHEKTEVHKGNVFSKRKQIARKQTKCALAGMNRGAKIACVGTSDGDESEKRHDLPPTPEPEVNRVLDALESSSLELHAAVKDPLSASLRIADNAVSNVTRKDTSNESMEESHARADPSVTQASNENLTNHSDRPRNNGSKPSLMAKNGTSCTLEWDDSIDEGNRVQLPSPKIRVVSPLKKYENHEIKRRRRAKKWSATEEDTLRAGVDKFGKGNWKLILKAYQTIFEERTEVDLKDKWRNLMR